MTFDLRIISSFVSLLSPALRNGFTCSCESRVCVSAVCDSVFHFTSNALEFKGNGIRLHETESSAAIGCCNDFIAIGCCIVVGLHTKFPDTIGVSFSTFSDVSPYLTRRA